VVRKYSAIAKPPEINAPVKQFRRLGSVCCVSVGWAFGFGVGVELVIHLLLVRLAESALVASFQTVHPLNGGASAHLAVSVRTFLTG